MLVNKSKDIVLTAHIHHCYSIFAQALGLMFSPKIKDKSLVFHFDKEKINSIHMLFVFQTIDVLYLDKKRKVIEIKQNLKPWQFYNPRLRSQYIIELPEDTVKNTKTAIDDIITWDR